MDPNSIHQNNFIKAQPSHASMAKPVSESAQQLRVYNNRTGHKHHQPASSLMTWTETCAPYPTPRRLWCCKVVHLRARSSSAFPERVWTPGEKVALSAFYFLRPLSPAARLLNWSAVTAAIPATWKQIGGDEGFFEWESWRELATIYAKDRSKTTAQAASPAVCSSCASNQPNLLPSIRSTCCPSFPSPVNSHPPHFNPCPCPHLIDLTSSRSR
ncbi:hypothetical protein V8F33_000329 [Rhypophila sp. PSN 637]